MTNQKTDNPSANFYERITPQKVAFFRIWNDLLLVVTSLIFLSPIINTSSARIVLGTVAAIFLGSLVGYFLIQQGRTILGMGFIIYGLLSGLTVLSIYLRGLGSFSIVTMVLVTALSVSFAIPFRRVIEAITASLVLGAFTLIYDINFQHADFRISPPPQFTSILWIITLLLIAILSYFIVRQFPYFSLRAKMITSFAVITILALSVLGILNSRSVQNVLTEQANQSLFNAAKQTEETIRTFISSNKRSIRTEANLPILIDYLSAEENDKEALKDQTLATLRALAEKDSTTISSYAILDLDGNVLLDTQRQKSSSNESDLSFFSQVIQQSTPTMSNVEIDPFTFEPSIYFSTPILNDSTPLGILRVRYKATVLQNIITRSNDRAGVNSFAVLFDENLIHLAHGIAPETIFTTVTPLDDDVFEKLVEDRRLPDQTQDETYLDLPELGANLNIALSSTEGVAYFEATDIATDDLINQVVVINMKDPAWLLAFFQPQEIYLASIEPLANNTILLALLSGFGAVVLGAGLTQILTKPIIDLKETAERVSQGDFRARTEITTEDEIGTLGKTFNAMTKQLQNLIADLESQVENRTFSLQNQAAQLRASTEVARDVTTEREVQDLLDRASNLIYDRFGFYHVGIYLKDSRNDFVALVASSDAPGKKLLQAEHRHQVNPKNNVGYACILGEPIIATAEENTSQLQFHPVLPNSQAQLVLPLNSGTETLGAIDIHSTNPASFKQDEVQIYQTLADQISTALQKAKYQEEIQQTLHELEAAYGTFTKDAWHKFVQERKDISGYRYNQKNVDIAKSPNQIVVKAWKDGQKISSKIQSVDKPEDEITILAIPLKVRGEVIGVLDIEFESSQVPIDTTDLISEIADRLGLILENARLIETAQRRVEREQLTSHISDAIRQSLDLDTVLRTAVQEIGESLGLAEVELRLGDIHQLKNNDQSSSNGKQDSDQKRN